MKVVFDRQPLASGISLVQDIVSTTTTMPILSNIMIEANKEDATITGTDLDSFGRVTLKARVEEAGRTTVPAKLLADIVKLLPEGEVTLESTGSRMDIQCNRNQYQLATMPADDYPEWPEVKADLTLTIKQGDLKRALHNTMFAIPSRDPRKVLMGVLFDFVDDKLTCVATDGRKLGKSAIEPSESRGTGRGHAIIPKRILDDIDNAIGEEGEIEMQLSERQVVFNLSNVSYVSNLIEGTYPKYDAVIPDSYVREIMIQKTSLADSISRAAILAEKKYHSIILHFHENQIDINAKSFEDGLFEGTIEADYDGEPFRIAFNHQYLQEIFKVTPDPVLKMKIKDTTSPVVFECESDPEALFLVMPVRMTELEEEEDAHAAAAE